MAVGVLSIVGSRGMGRSSTISTSNTIKIIASRKNRIENGIRAVFLGSNPHSNADDFSRSLLARIFKNHESRNVSIAIVDAIVASVNGRIIIRKF
jgi:hypothetical protein